MSAMPPRLLLAGLAGLLGLMAAALFGTAGTAFSYLAAWLVLLALPLGALPWLMGAELFGLDAGPATPALRRLAGLMPIAALAGLPVLASVHALYPSLGHGEGVLGAWMGTGFFLCRAVLMLLAWTALALLFVRPAAQSRRGLAGGGLAIHLAIGTIAAGDWVLALEPGFASSGFGLLVMVAQAGLALAAALLMAAFASGTLPRSLGIALLVALASWIFLAFTHFLVVWSANLPAEVAWYQHRGAGIGRSAEVAAALVTLLAVAMLSWRGLARHTGVVAGAAALLVLLHGVEMLWLVTPAARGHFSLTLADMLALVGLAGTGLGATTLSWTGIRRRLGYG